MDRSKAPSVNVILATYNGEEYIERQLNSIEEQDYKNIDIYIRDDGSTDRTPRIIDEYAAAHSNVHVIKDDKGNLGCPESFYEVLRVCPEADFYAFSDQDDIWEPFKIRRAVSGLSKLKSGLPALTFSGFDYYTESGEYIRSFPKQKRFPKLYDCLYYTPGLGFTICFNEALRKVALPARPPQGVRGDRTYYGELHDRRFIKAAVCFGVAVYDERSTAKHIRHADSVTAADKGYIDLLKRWIRDEFFGNEMKYEKLGIRRFLTDYKTELSKGRREILCLFADEKKSILLSLKRAAFPRRLRPSLMSEILLRILLLTGRI